MDWSKIKVPEPTRGVTRPTSGALSTLDAFKLVVISKLINKSVAAIIQTAILTYLNRNWEDHETRLLVEANRLGLTPEELFNRLAQGEEVKDG